MNNQNMAEQVISGGEVDTLVKEAETIGSALARQLTTSQIRNVFGEVRRIEMGWPSVQDTPSEEDKRKAESAYRQTVLLRPKLAYLAKKERGRGVEELQQVLDPCIAQIQEAQTDEERKLRFERFVDFFEAILAYHKAAGGN